MFVLYDQCIHLALLHMFVFSIVALAIHFFNKNQTLDFVFIQINATLYYELA